MSVAVSLAREQTAVQGVILLQKVFVVWALCAVMVADIRCGIVVVIVYGDHDDLLSGVFNVCFLTHFYFLVFFSFFLQEGQAAASFKFSRCS